jgi:hypothetical protein
MPRIQSGGVDAKDPIRTSMTRNINSSEPIKRHANEPIRRQSHPLNNQDAEKYQEIIRRKKCENPIREQEGQEPIRRQR